LVFGRRDEDVRVVGHDYKAVELEAVFIAMLEECCDEEFGVGWFVGSGDVAGRLRS
jgi:hypothetical protein